MIVLYILHGYENIRVQKLLSKLLGQCYMVIFHKEIVGIIIMWSLPYKGPLRWVNILWIQHNRMKLRKRRNVQFTKLLNLASCDKTKEKHDNLRSKFTNVAVKTEIGGAIHKLCSAKIGNFWPPSSHVTLSVKILIDLNKRNPIVTLGQPPLWCYIIYGRPQSTHRSWFMWSLAKLMRSNTWITKFNSHVYGN